MFVAEAHSFRQQARLAITLAWVAGYTNIQTILVCATTTSHVSGTASGLGRDIAEGRWDLAGFAAMLLVAFFLGAALSALCTEGGRRLGWESIYVLPMALQGVMLGVFAVGIEIHQGNLIGTGATHFWLTLLATAAMGLQNATITRISSGVVRTTHVTGVLTDLGIDALQVVLWAWDRRRTMWSGGVRVLAQKVRTQPNARRVALLASIFGSFMVGACLSTAAHEHFARWAMVPPVLFLAWVVFQDITRPIAEIEVSSLLSAENKLELPEGLAIFHVRKSPENEHKPHQMPNLMMWSERLPPEARIIILDFGLSSQIDQNVALELHALLLGMKAHGQKLIISGIAPDQYEHLRAAWGGSIGPGDICPDLDLAIAEGIVALETIASSAGQSTDVVPRGI